MVALLFRRLAHGDGLPLPSRATAQAAGLDLYAACDSPMVLAMGARALVPTGLVALIPDGHEAQIRPRSGLALRHGVTVLNAPGTIDADYRGELMVLLVNLGEAPFTIERGARIAQLVLSRLTEVEVGEAGEEMAGPAAGGRGEGGFGSTGR